jgi:hypothetical protein
VEQLAAGLLMLGGRVPSAAAIFSPPLQPGFKYYNYLQLSTTIDYYFTF